MPPRRAHRPPVWRDAPVSTPMSEFAGHVVALAGGVGGAKLADGLARLLGDRLTVIVNTGDDFTHLGLHISPDLDTVMYTLAGIANPQTGWGIAGETWSFLGQMGRLGGPAWFRLGDRDLATHVLRSERLAAGDTHYGGHRRAEPRARRRGDHPADERRSRAHDHPHRGRRAAVSGLFRTPRPARSPSAASVTTAHLRRVSIRPSRGYESFRHYHLPIESLSERRSDPGGAGHAALDCARRAVRSSQCRHRRGAAIKGPAAKIMAELGAPASAVGIARHYAGLVDGLVIDTVDQRPRATDRRRGHGSEGRADGDVQRG